MNKTLWIIDHYSSEPKYGGYTRQYNIARGLDNLGYNVVVIASSFSHFLHEYFSDQECLIQQVSEKVHYVYLKTTSYESNTDYRRLLGMLSFERKVIKYRKKIEEEFGIPTWIVSSSPHPFTWTAGYHVSKCNHARFNIEIRDFWPLELREKDDSTLKKSFLAGLDELETWAFKKAQRIIVTAPYGAEYCRDTGKASTEKCISIGQPLDCDAYNKCADQNWNLVPEKIRLFTENSFFCLFSGYYMRYEGVFEMLQAAKELQEKNSPVKFVFVGSGNEENSMKQFAESNKLDNVLIYGRIPKETLPALQQRSNICLGYLYDADNPDMFRYGMSKNKVNEYLYSGAVTIMGFPDMHNEITDSEGGFVFHPGENRFAELIEQVYTMDAAQRRKIGEKARTYVEKNHGIQALAQRYADEVLRLT